MNTIGDMQNEMNFYGYCIMFEYSHDFLKFLEKIDDDTLEYVVLDIYCFE